MTWAPAEEARLWLAALGPTGAIVAVWVMLKRQLFLIHRDQLSVLKESLGRLERAMTNAASELILAGKRLDKLK